MKVGNLYELSFPYEEGQGSKKRPVLLLVVNDEKGKVIGLKVTRTGPNKKHPFRIKIENSPSSNLSETSYVQYDVYGVFDKVTLKSRGKIGMSDFKAIAMAFKEFHGV